MTNRQHTAADVHRIQWMDNLRTMTILLVVLYHVGGVYESAGLWAWFWIVDDPATLTWVGIIGIVLDIFMMPTLFFISGYLTPGSLKNKTEWEFVKGKFKRLMIPWIFAVVTLIPAYKVIFLYSRNLPQENWQTYFHITNPNSQNWLWFLPVLFLFEMLFLLFSKTKIGIPHVSFKSAVWGTFLLGFIYSISIGSMLGFRSWTLTPLIDFDNERLLAYFSVFMLGVFCFDRKVFLKKPGNKLQYSVISSMAWFPVTVHIFTRIYPFFYSEGFSVTLQYRLIWWLSFYLSLLCLLYIMIETFWRYFNKEGKIWSELNRNSYGVYIIHVIVIGVFGTLLLRSNLPAVLKYLSLIILTYLVSNLIVSYSRKLLKKLQSV
ncbi:MAG: acyltransferase [SAR324 cluster bacterium]|nr:acyltransferase [SAR324 cluster bacterium]